MAATLTAEVAADDAPQVRPARRSPVVGVAVALLLAPPVLDLLLSGRRRLFSYLAADAFYYLRVADEWATSGRLSFDGERPANGFHPLWQLALAGAARVQRGLGLSDLWLVGFAVGAGLVLLALAVIVLGRVLRAAYGTVSPLYALVPVGLYALTLIPLWLRFGAQEADSLPATTDLPLYGTLWSWANGMETPAVVLAFALLALAWVRWGAAGGRLAALQGLAAALLVLARLDTAVVVAGWLGTILVVAALRRDARLARTAVIAGAVVAVVLAAYLAWNAWYASEWLPTSGTTKSTFPDAQLDNLRDIRSLLTLRDESFGRGRLYREWPIVVPAVVAAAWVVGAARGLLRRDGADSPRARYRLLLTGTALGVLALSAYDLLFVQLWDQGHWYLPLSMLFVTLAALDVVERTSLAGRLAARPTPVLVGAAAVAVAVFVGLGRPDAYHQRFADFFVDEAPRIHAFYGDDRPRLLAWDDGADAFSLGYPALSGTLLMLDPAGVDAYEDGRLLELAVARGYDRFSSVQYMDARGLDRDTPSGVLRDRLQDFFPGEDLSPYEFEVEYVGGDGLTPPWPGAAGRYVTIHISRAP